MRLSLSNFGLRTRAVVLCVLLLLSTAGVVGSVQIQQHRQYMLAALTNAAATFARAIAVTAEPAILLDDSGGYERVLQTAAADPTVIDVRIFNESWEQLAGRSRREQGGYLFFPPAAQAGGSGERSFRYEDHPVRLISLPEADGSLDVVELYGTADELVVVARVLSSPGRIELPELEAPAAAPSNHGEPIGYIVLSHTLAPLHREVLHHAVSGALLTLAVLIAGCAATVVAVRQLLRPLNNLVETTQAIAAGDRAKRARETAVGEIGALARSFNHMADRLQESYESIEQVVAERTAELVQASRAKDDFLANMSHEIRTPMTAILGYTEHLIDPQLDAAEREIAVETVRRNGQHLLQIINDILDLSKIEAGRLSIERVPCSILHLLADVASLMRVRAREKQLAFSADFEGAIPTAVLTDPTRLRQILLNLVSNAIKFTERGSVRIVGRMVASLAAAGGSAAPVRGQRLQFDIVDTGIGMTPEQLGKVFRPFTQGDETMSRRFGGTGLGLAISKRLASLLGGDIEVFSAAGQGSTFRVTIDPGPLTDVDWIIDPSLSLESVRRTAPAEPTAEASQSLSGARILLAEDGPDNQRLVATLLRRAGASVTVVENGRLAVDEALAPTNGEPSFDLILMDMQMPEMDGYTATRILRQAAYPRPIVALTAHAMSTDRDKCLEAGCDDYTTKPIDRDRLINLLARHLRRASEPAAAAVP